MKIKETTRQKTIVEIIIECIGFVVIICGVITSIRMNLQGHSLWWDEAALAYSFSQRSLTDLTSAGLEKLQSAPVGWLYILKICTLIFGNTDFVLRVPSILAYVGTIVLAYWVMRTVFKIHYPMVGAAFIASLPIILQYSNIFKPYITDCFFSLLVVVVFFYYREHKIGWLKLGCILSIIVWFSNPSCFVAGGMIAASFLNSIVKKNIDGIKNVIKMCIPLFISFVVYYFYWLRQTANDETMLFYWKDWNLPLIPNSVEDLRQIMKCAGTIFAEFYRVEYIVIIVLIACLVYAWHKQDWMYWGIYIGFAVCLLASALGKFPVNKRLWLYIYPLVVIVISVGIDALISNGENKKISSTLVGVIMLGCCLLNGGIRYYWNMDNTYWPRYEVKKDYEYIMDHIKSDESVYVCVNQTPIFDYYNEYVDGTLNGLPNVVMEGDNEYMAPYDYVEDIRYITEKKKCYVMMGDGWTVDYFMEDLFRGLYQAGYFEMIYNPYETPLWYYCTDIEDTRTNLFYEVNQNEEGMFLRIYNKGEAYINTQYQNLSLQICDADNHILYSYNLAENIAPECYVNLPIDTLHTGEYTIRLANTYKEITRSQNVMVDGKDQI